MVYLTPRLDCLDEECIKPVGMMSAMRIGPDF